MRVRALDGTGDWTFGSGNSNYLTGKSAVAQSIQTRLNMFANDCFFAMSGWIDWFNTLGTNNNQQFLELAITNIILQTPYVYKITSFSLTASNRVMNLSYAVETMFGNITVSGQEVGVPITYLTNEAGQILTSESGAQITL